MDLEAWEEGSEILILLEEGLLWNALTINDIILILEVLIEIASGKAILFILIINFFLEILFVEEMNILLGHSFKND